jgi:hypothetical protein
VALQLCGTPYQVVFENSKNAPWQEWWRVERNALCRAALQFVAGMSCWWMLVD